MPNQEHLENAKTTMRRGTIEISLLAILSHGEAYTSDLVNILTERGVLVIEGTVYPILSRLKKQGYLEYRWEESTQGPPRKYFSLSKTGKEYYQAVLKIWEEMVDMVGDLETGKGLNRD